MFKLQPVRVIKFLADFFYLSLVILTPCFFSFFLKTSNVFELEKAVIFRILTVLFLFTVFLLALFDQKFWFMFKSRFQKFWKFFLIPLFFLFGIILMTVFSDFPYISFWGTYDFQFGLYNFIFIFIFFIFSIIWLDSALRLRRVLVVISFAALLVCLYGVMQIIGFDFFHWSESTRGRIFSSLGQPNFLASYLLLVIPISLYLFFSQKNKWRYLYGLTVFLEIFCLFFTYSRAGILGIISASLFFSIFLIYKKHQTRLGRAFTEKKYYLSLLVVFSALLLLFIFSSGVQRKRMLHSFDLKSGSVASRVQYFESAWSAFQKRPLLGYGWQTQRDIFAAYYEKDWAIHNNVNAIPAQAHNVVIDYLLQGGVVGLVMWLLLNLFFIRIAWENIVENKSRFLSLAILFAWFSYTFSLLFGFAVLTTEIYFWLFLAILINSGEVYDGKLPEVESKKYKRKYEMIVFGAKISLTVIFLFVLFFFFRRELRIIIADHYFYKIESALAANQHFEAYLLYDWIKDLNVNENNYRLKFGDLVSHSINQNDSGIWVEGAQRLILPNLVSMILGNSYDEVCTRANVYAALSLNKKTDYSHQSESDFFKCIKMAPGIPKNYRDFARFYIGRGNYQEAENYLNKAEALLPELQNEKINEDHRRKIKEELYLNNMFKGDIYIGKKDYFQAETFYRRAKSYFDSGSQIEKKIADTYYLRGDYASAINVILEIRNKEGFNYYWPYLIALLYLEKGDYVSADIYLTEAESINPKNPYVIELRNDINDKLLNK